MDGFTRLKVEVKGVVSLMMHNGQLANPLNEHARAISEYLAANKGTKAKTDAVYKHLSYLEFRGGLYLMDGGKAGLIPCVPAACIMATMRNAAKRFKMQPIVRVGLLVPHPVGYPLLYDGPTDVDSMFSHGNGKTFVDQTMMKVNRAPILRTRAIFRQWSLKFELDFDPAVLNRKQVVELIETAGRMIGMCESRPECGRYEVVGIK